MNEFENAEQAPNDIYEYEKTTKGPSRFQAALVATTGFVIFGGLVGGGAFAMTGGLPGILPGAPSVAAVDPSATDPALVDPSATDPALVDPSATPTDTPLDQSATPTDLPLDPSATPGTQIVVPPVFGGDDNGGEDGKGEHQGGRGGDGDHKPGGKHHKPNPTASLDPSASPSFTSDDESETEEPDDN